MMQCTLSGPVGQSSDLIFMTYVLLQELLKILTKLMTVCLYFSESLKKFARTKGVCELELLCCLRIRD